MQEGGEAGGVGGVVAVVPESEEHGQDAIAEGRVED